MESDESSHEDSIRTESSSEGERDVFTCGTCGEVFASRRNLVIHERVHREREMFRCEVCGRVYTRRDSIRHSRAEHHTTPTTTTTTTTSQGRKRAPRERGAFTCGTCGQVYTRRDNMLRHVQAAHGSVLAGCNVIATETFIQCYNNNQLYWISAQYIYKGLLLAFGTFLAWETRHVRIPALNEIGFCVYNVVVVCVFGVPIYHLLAANQSNLRFLISSSLIIFCTTLVLCIVFIPKILRRNDSEKPGIFLTVDGSVKSRVSDNDKASETVVPFFTRTSKVAPEASTSLSTAHLVAHNASALDVQQG